MLSIIFSNFVCASTLLSPETFILSIVTLLIILEFVAKISANIVEKNPYA